MFQGGHFLLGLHKLELKVTYLPARVSWKDLAKANTVEDLIAKSYRHIHQVYMYCIGLYAIVLICSLTLQFYQVRIVAVLQNLSVRAHTAVGAVPLCLQIQLGLQLLHLQEESLTHQLNDQNPAAADATSLHKALILQVSQLVHLDYFQRTDTHLML